MVVALDQGFIEQKVNKADMMNAAFVLPAAPDVILEKKRFAAPPQTSDDLDLSVPFRVDELLK